MSLLTNFKPPWFVDEEFRAFSAASAAETDEYLRRADAIQTVIRVHCSLNRAERQPPGAEEETRAVRRDMSVSLTLPIWIGS
jgi:hypothetical protein